MPLNMLLTEQTLILLKDADDTLLFYKQCCEKSQVPHRMGRSWMVLAVGLHPPWAIVELNAQLEPVFLLCIAHKLEHKPLSLPTIPCLPHGVPWLFRCWVNSLLGYGAVTEEKVWGQQREGR